MIPELLAKAQRSAEAARALVALGASDDAASRAYYIQPRMALMRRLLETSR